MADITNAAARPRSSISAWRRRIEGLFSCPSAAAAPAGLVGLRQAGAQRRQSLGSPRMFPAGNWLSTPVPLILAGNHDIDKRVIATSWSANHDSFIHNHDILGESRHDL